MCWGNADFYFVPYYKRTGIASFVQPKSRFTANKLVMRFGKLAKNLGGRGDGLRKKGR
jgi:hypothetical protein